MRFTKMHGLGNDYVYVNCFEEQVEDPVALARAISDRHFGVGSDGLILIMPSEQAEVRMRMFNADGSEGRMCGNGLRCLAKYAYEHGLSRENPMRVETAAGVKQVDLAIEDDLVTQATVDMGEPILEADLIGVRAECSRIVDFPIATSAGQLLMTCVSMGNPHAVIFVDDVAAVLLEKLGPELENHPVFRDSVNVHFVQVDSLAAVTMRPWERGSGPTLACGSGASAVCVAGVLVGRTGRKITAHLPGGDLGLEWRSEDNRVLMTGPAVEAFSGDWPG